MHTIPAPLKTGAGACLFLLAFSIMVPLTRATLWAGTPVADSLVLAYVLGGAGLWLAINLSFRGLGQARPSAQALLARDPRPPVLILRPAAQSPGTDGRRRVDPLTQPA